MGREETWQLRFQGWGWLPVGMGPDTMVPVSNPSSATYDMHDLG